ncbi:MAG: hypothetical protein A2Z20_07035 [Bdellovibrionales bacterium RBG_16_40_8]|nr:MAG: hypothetical protein A2Z20_07035 [Bdellovibrionales bacterium RBG_16_40_8]
MRRIFVFIILSLVANLFLPVTWAAQVKSVKGKNIVINMQKDSFKIDDVLEIKNSRGKTIGLVNINKVKGKLAYGTLKGKVKKGLKVQLQQIRTAETKQTETKRFEEKPKKRSRYRSRMLSSKTVYGIMIGFNSTSTEIKLPTTPTATTVSPGGTGFSLKGAMDYPLFPWLGFRGMFGLEQFKIGGASNSATKANGGCDGECIAEINYLSADFWGRGFLTPQSKFRSWLGLGFDIMFPITKKSTALKESSITNTSIIAIGGGADWILSDKSYVPLQIEYNLYPSSKQVTASAIALRFGYTLAF